MPSPEEQRILDACDERLPDYDDFRLLKRFPTEGRIRRFNFLVETDPGDGRTTVVVGGRIPESSLVKDPLVLQPSECAGMAFPDPQSSP